MLRHGLAALVVLGLLVPLMPAAGNAMACCRGTGEACVCPLELGFSRCERAPEITPPQTPPALLPVRAPVLTLQASTEALPQASEALLSLARRPAVPPPRA